MVRNARITKENIFQKTGRILIIVLCLVFVSVFFGACSDNQKSSDSQLTILYTNDIHCSYENYPTLAAYKETLKSSGTNTILVDGGDFVQGNPVGATDKGAAMIQLMNKVGYDYAVPGNHDYDYGADAFLKNAQNANFKWLTCNSPGGDKYQNEFKRDPYKIIEVGKHKIALLGIEHNEKVDTYTDKVKKAIADAKVHGADFVIAIGHTGDNTKELIQKTSGIDIFLNAHNHVISDAKGQALSYKNTEGKKVPIYETGTEFKYVGKLVLDCETKEIKYNFELKSPDSLYLEIKNSMPESAEKVRDACQNIAAKCDKIMEPYKVEIGRTECTFCCYDPVTFPQYTNYIEYNSTDFIADAFRSAGKTDIAFVNLDSVRKGLFPGKVTKLDIYNFYPWNNKVYTTKLSGQDIINILEYNLRNYPEYTPASPAVSGMTFAIDPTVPWTENSNNRIKDVKIGDEPIDASKTYSVTFSEYYLFTANKGIINKTVNDCTDIGIDFDLIESYIKNDLDGVIPRTLYCNPAGLHRIK